MSATPEVSVSPAIPAVSLNWLRTLEDWQHRCAADPQAAAVPAALTKTTRLSFAGPASAAQLRACAAGLRTLGIPSMPLKGTASFTLRIPDGVDQTVQFEVMYPVRPVDLEQAAIDLENG